MPRPRKTWQEQLPDNKGFPKVVVIEGENKKAGAKERSQFRLREK